jgi:LysM repeat protein
VVAGNPALWKTGVKKFDGGGFRVFHFLMKKIFSLFFAAAISTVALQAQDAATQQQLDKLGGQIQDAQDAIAQQGKQLEAMEKEISDLRDKLNTPAVNNSASADDLKALAAQVQEIDKKRQDDRDLILKEIEKLGKVGGSPTARSRETAETSTPSRSDETSTTDTGTPQKGYEYTVGAGDTLSAIAKAYREKGVKVTTTQILKANPGLDASKLYVGKKILIPDLSGK